MHGSPSATSRMAPDGVPRARTLGAPRGRAGPYASTPARRAEIVRAALASFAEHGYERASLRDIAARANVTHAALLRHFASKDDLLARRARAARRR